MIDDELGSDARALLSAGRDRLGPDPATVTRLRVRVDAAVATGGAGTAAKAAKVVTAAKAATAVKLGLIVLVAAAIGAVVHTRRGADQEPRVPPPEARRLAAVPMLTPTPAVGNGAPTVPAPVAPPAPHLDSAPRVVRAAPAIAPLETKPPSLAREIELVDRATNALHRGDVPDVLDTIRRYDAETAGKGQLAQDAAAIEIEALCKTGDASSATKLDAFDHRWPRSAQRPRLTAACANPKKETP